MQKKVQNSDVEFNFDKQMTTAIKGVAICIMLFHHFIGFPDWVNEGNVIYGIPFADRTLEYYLAVFGKICVAMYTFLSGYGLYISYRNKDKIWDFKYLLRKTVQLLVNWWLIVLIVEMPVSLFGDSGGGIQKIIGHLTLTQLDGNPFIGYIKFYLLALWTSPLCYTIVKKTKRVYAFVLILPFLGIVLRKLLVATIGENDLLYTYLLYIPYFLTGMVICKSKLYNIIYQYIKKLKFYDAFCVVLLIVVIVSRLVFGNQALSFDSWFSLSFIFGIACMLQKQSYIKMMFLKLGRYSTNLWYSHAVWIFGGVTMQKILYSPRIPTIILVWGILLCMPGVLIVSWLMKKIKV